VKTENLLRVSLRSARGSALSVVGRFPLGGRNITAVHPPCPQGVNIDRLSRLVIGGWRGVPGAFVVHSPFVFLLIVDDYVHYLTEVTLLNEETVASILRISEKPLYPRMWMAKGRCALRVQLGQGCNKFWLVGLRLPLQPTSVSG
jgi:hypothetical protein